MKKETSAGIQDLLDFDETEPVAKKKEVVLEVKSNIEDSYEKTKKNEDLWKNNDICDFIYRISLVIF